jgi:hypothetical protein
MSNKELLELRHDGIIKAIPTVSRQPAKMDSWI